MATGKSGRLCLFVLSLTFFILALIYSLVTPPFESPDEAGHLHYIVHGNCLPSRRSGRNLRIGVRRNELLALLPATF